MFSEVNWDNAEDPIVKLFVGFDVEGYVEEYEFCADDYYYSPTEHDRVLLVDAIYGVVSNLHEELRKLIPSSAAPELLECLKDARRLLTDQDAIDLEHIDEVIAKAEGSVA